MDIDIQIMYIFFLGCFMVMLTRVLRIIGTVNGIMIVKLRINIFYVV